MPKKIIWSSLSEKDLSDIMSYLNKEWDAKIANQFMDIIEKILKQISLNPKQFPLINKKRKVRKCVITSLTSHRFLLPSSVFLLPSALRLLPSYFFTLRSLPSSFRLPANHQLSCLNTNRLVIYLTGYQEAR